MTPQQAEAAIKSIKQGFAGVIADVSSQFGEDYHPYEAMYAALETAAEIANVEVFASACGEVAQAHWGGTHVAEEKSPIILRA